MQRIFPFLFGLYFLFSEVAYFKLLDFFGGSYFNYSIFCLVSIFFGYALGSYFSNISKNILAIFIIVINLSFYLLFDKMPEFFQLGGEITSYTFSFLILSSKGFLLGNIFPSLLKKYKNNFFILESIGGVAGILLFELVFHSFFGIHYSLILIAVLTVPFLLIKKEKNNNASKINGKMITLGAITGMSQALILVISIFVFSNFFFVEPLILLSSILGLGFGALVFKKGFSLQDYKLILALAIFLFSFSLIKISNSYGSMNLHLFVGVYLFLVFVLQTVLGGLFPVYFSQEKNKEINILSGANFSLVLGNILGYLGILLFCSIFNEIQGLALTILFLAIIMKKDRVMSSIVFLLALIVFNFNFVKIINFSYKKAEAISIEKDFREFGGYSAIYKAEDSQGIEQRRLFQFGYSAINLKERRESRIGEISYNYSKSKNKALVIGGGSGLSAGVIAQEFKKTDLVDIDPTSKKMLEYLKDYNLNVLNNVNFYNQDAILFKSKDKYDLILLTADPVYHKAAEKLYTKEFFEKVKKMLATEGIFVFWMDSTVDEYNQEVILNTAKSVFKHQKGVFINNRSFFGNYAAYINSEKEILINSQGNEFVLMKDQKEVNSWKKNTLKRYLKKWGIDDEK